MKVKRTTYQSSSSKNNEIITLTNEIKNAIQKIEEKKNKTVNQYLSLIQSIKKEYQRVANENNHLNTVKQECIGGVSQIFIQKKNFFLFDSLGFTGFKESIIDGDLNIIDKLLYTVNKFNKNDEKINLINLKF